MSATGSNRINALYIPASRPMWGDFAQQLATRGIEPTVWLGDWRNYASGKKNFPDCTVLGLREVQARISAFPVEHVPDAAFLTSRGFLQLKAQSMKLMDRQDETRTFGRLERDAYFYSMVTRLYSLIVSREIGVAIASEAPHHVAQLIAFRLCELLGIPTYHLVNNTFVPLVHVTRSIVGEPIRVTDKPDVTSLADLLVDSLEQYRDGIPTPLYMTNQAKRDRSWSFLGWAGKYWRNLAKQRIRALRGKPEPFRDDVQIRSRYPFQPNTRRASMPFIVESLRRALEREYPRHAVTVDLSAADLPRFVYFPMPFEPERTSLPDGGDFYEAMDVLLALREFLPDDIHIFVKEHPTQFSRTLPGYKARSPLVYSVLSRLPNTRLIDLSVSSASLISHAEFTVTITGTAALESALIGKKGVVFGTPWFEPLPGVYRFDDVKDYRTLESAPPASLDDIVAAARILVREVAIPGVISVEQQTYFTQKFGESLARLVDDEDTIVTVAEAIRSDLVGR